MVGIPFTLQQLDISIVLGKCISYSTLGYRTLNIMIRRHIIDKFGHSLFLGKRALSEEDDYMVDDDGTKKLRTAGDPERDRRLVSRGYLDRFYAPKTEIEGLNGKLSSVKIKLSEFDKLYVPKTDMDALRGQMTGVQTQLSEVAKIYVPKTDLDALRGQLTGVQTQLSEVDKLYVPKSDVNALKGQLASVETKLSEVEKFYVSKTDMDGLKEQLTSLQTILIELQQGNQELQSYFDSVKTTTNTELKTTLDCCYNANDKRISHVADGIDADDVSTVRQTLTYDAEKDTFRCGSKEFQLVINDPLRPVVVADPNVLSGLAIYRGTEYNHKFNVYNNGTMLLTYQGYKLVWDDQYKIITPLYV